MKFVIGRRINALLLLLSVSVSWNGIGLVEASAPVPQEGKDAVAEGSETAFESVSESEDAARYKFVHRTVIIPHDDKKHRGGEDAASTIDSMLVVADGVGGWANRGVNPGLFSIKLTETITSAYARLTVTDKADPDFDLKNLVHESNIIAANAHLGSATCTVVRLKETVVDANADANANTGPTLETVNVGDSGYSIHRKKNRAKKGESPTAKAPPLKVVYASIPGQKGFNFPYQLGGQYGDQVYDENVTDGPKTHTLQPKDVIVVVSDGVIDNIDPIGYHPCIQKYQWWSAANTGAGGADYGLEDGDLVSHSAVADCIAKKAYFLGKDRNHYSPFARSAASYGKRYLGGKHDDITVVVAQVRDAGAPDTVDPHKNNESVFLYKDSDGPIGAVEDLPAMEDLLEALRTKQKPLPEGQPLVEQEL